MSLAPPSGTTVYDISMTDKDFNNQGKIFPVQDIRNKMVFSIMFQFFTSMFRPDYVNSICLNGQRNVKYNFPIKIKHG